jgi:hypothetical protein
MWTVDSDDVELNNLIEELITHTLCGKIAWDNDDCMLKHVGDGYMLTMFDNTGSNDEGIEPEKYPELMISWNMCGTSSCKSVWNTHTERLYNAVINGRRKKLKEKPTTFHSEFEVMRKVLGR